MRMANQKKYDILALRMSIYFIFNIIIKLMVLRHTPTHSIYRYSSYQCAWMMKNSLRNWSRKGKYIVCTIWFILHSLSTLPDLVG